LPAASQTTGDPKPWTLTVQAILLQALQNPEHDARHADAWCCGAILYMLLGGAFPFLTMAEAARGPMRQLHSLVQRITSGRFLPLARSVSISGFNFDLHSVVQRVGRLLNLSRFVARLEFRPCCSCAHRQQQLGALQLGLLSHSQHR
jgi:hypothetical protein